MTPSKAPQLAHPNTSSAMLSSHNDVVSEESDDDMAAAVLAAGDGLGPKSKSRVKGNAASAQENTQTPSQTKDTQPSNTSTKANTTSPAVTPQSLAAPSADETKTTRPEVEDLGGDANRNSSVEPTNSKQSAELDGVTHVTNNTTSSNTGDLLGRPHQKTDTDTQSHPTTSETTTNDNIITLPELENPTEKEIEDAEIREAQAAVEASRTHGTDPEAKVDAETAKQTDQAMHTAVTNSGPAGAVTGMGVGMSATSGPMSDMPMA